MDGGKEREVRREGEVYTARAGAGPRWQPHTPAGSPVWVAGDRHLHHFLLAPQVH